MQALAQACPRTVVHSFRTVVADAGANLGLIVSSAGFQSGAREAVNHTNVRLVNWGGFQEIYVQRWYERYMAPVLYQATGPLFSYTEPFNSRIFRKADALDETRQRRFGELRRKHAPLVFALPVVHSLPFGATCHSATAIARPAAA